MTHIRKDFQHHTADSVTLDNGISSSVVGDLQAMNDGNAYRIEETVGDPGMRLRVHFINLSKVSTILVMAYYTGTVNHAVSVELYNYITTNWDVIHTLNAGVGYEQHFKGVPDGAKYIDSNGNAIMRFNHAMQGIPAHDLYIDYAAVGY